MSSFFAGARKFGSARVLTADSRASTLARSPEKKNKRLIAGFKQTFLSCSAISVELMMTRILNQLFLQSQAADQKERYRAQATRLGARI